MAKHQHRRLKLTITLLVLVTPVIVFTQRFAIFDWWRLRGYQPPAAVSRLADETSMNATTRRLFYVYRPEIQDKEAFNSHCRDDEQTIVLGCYIDGQGIYIFNVTDVRLKGIEEVTAAHEILHAAYARLSTTERNQVDNMTKLAFAQLTDQGIKDRIELYRKKDASVIPNELHSILGTEATSLSADLEDYYKQYFNDRQKVVSFGAAYAQAFTDRKNQIIAYDTQLDSLKGQIDSLQTDLSQASDDLSSRRQQLDGLRNSNQIEAYNSDVPSFNQQVKSYNNMVNKLSGLVSEYNDIVSQRNELATEEQSLTDAIDSREAVPPKQ